MTFLYIEFPTLNKNSSYYKVKIDQINCAENLINCSTLWGIYITIVVMRSDAEWKKKKMKRGKEWTKALHRPNVYPHLQLQGADVKASWYKDSVWHLRLVQPRFDSLIPCFGIVKNTLSKMGEIWIPKTWSLFLLPDGLFHLHSR